MTEGLRPVRLARSAIGHGIGSRADVRAYPGTRADWQGLPANIDHGGLKWEQSMCTSS